MATRPEAALFSLGFPRLLVPRGCWRRWKPATPRTWKCVAEGPSPVRPLGMRGPVSPPCIDTMELTQLRWGDFSPVLWLLHEWVMTSQPPRLPQPPLISQPLSHLQAAATGCGRHTPASSLALVRGQRTD